ncbi:MAG: IS110 family transposase [Treponema sp.]|jgi:transposase|nr:IS110 family transposase [Treponema sp.]
MKNRINAKIEEITANTLIVGVDIAKETHWARFVDYRGMEAGKTVSFTKDKKGFEKIIAEIEKICKSKILKEPFEKVIIGMEPTGHYWKTLANYLEKKEYTVVCVNPYHTKKAKELDDNSPTASDKKDAITIARLVKDGRYFEPYLPEEVYAELRILTNIRHGILKRKSAAKNNITAVLDEYFPEITTVFKNPLTGKASRQVLKYCPFPGMIMILGETGVLRAIKEGVKKTVGLKTVRKLIAAAEDSIGVEYGLESAGLKLRILLAELELAEKQLAEVEASMENMLHATGYSKQILSIKGIGIISAASFLGEVGNPLRFDNARQISNYAGYNLTEDSSGKNKSGTCISKRGRKQLRSVLYKMALTMVATNSEMKQLYSYLKTRKYNPLKKKQALVVISKKIITIIYSLLKKQETYNPELALGEVRKEMMSAA